MSNLEVIDRMRRVIKDQSDLIYDLYGIVEQADLTGSGVEEATARAAAITEEVKAIDSAVGGEISPEAPPPLPDSSVPSTLNANGGQEHE